MSVIDRQTKRQIYSRQTDLVMNLLENMHKKSSRKAVTFQIFLWDILLGPLEMHILHVTMQV